MQLLDQDRKKIRDAMQEASNSLIRIDAEKDLIKNIVEDLNEAFEIPKKTLSKMIKVYHKQNFQEEVASHDEFETLYETITGQSGE
jgi:hypothetical protein